MSKPFVAVVLACLVSTNPNASAAPPSEAPAERADFLGDALPPDAVFRLGTIRLRHPTGVEGLAFSPDGKSLASSDYWGLVRVWDASNGKLRFELPRGTGQAVAFSPDGKLLATGGDDTAVRTWNAANGREIRTLRERGGRTAMSRSHAARCLAFAPDSKALLCEDGTTSVLLLDVESGKEKRRFDGLKYQPHAVAFSPDGQWVAAGDSINFAGGESIILVWDVASGEQRCRITDPNQGWVYGLAFSPDGKVLASATPYHVCFWDAATGKRLEEFKERVSGAVAFDAEGKGLVTGGDVCIIDPTHRRVVRRMGQGYNFAVVAAVAPDGKTIASNAVYDERIRLWDAATGKEKLVAGHHDEIRTAAFSPDGKLIATGSGGDGTVRLWDAARGTELRTLKLKGEPNHFARGRSIVLRFSADSRTVSAAGQSWDVATGKETETAAEPRGQWSVFSPDGQTMARVEEGADRYPVLVLRDSPTGRLLHRLLPQGKIGRLLNTGAIGFSPDGRLLATGYLEEMPGGQRAPVDTVRLWDVATGKQLRSFRSATDAPAFVVFSPEGELLVTSGFWQHPPQLWDVTTGKEVRKLGGHQDDQRHWDEFNPVVFSPDGGLLATGGKDNVIVLWETATGGVVRTLHGHTRPVRSLTFSADGQTLVSGSADTTALVWPVLPAGAIRKWDAGGAGALWRALEGEPAVAFPALWALAAAPDQAVPFLKEQLRPDAELDERQLTQWIADLGHTKFVLREEATRRLRDFGVRAEPALRKALAGQDDPERRRRLEDLLARLDGKGPDAVLLRDLRAILALEQMRTKPAKAFLEALARGGDNGPRTRAAQAALVRLEARRQQGRLPAPAPLPGLAPQGRDPRKLYSHDDEVLAVAFTPDGKVALSAGKDGKVRRWNLGAAKELPALAGHDGGTFALATAPDGRQVASAGADGRVRLWDLDKGAEAASLTGHKGAVFAVSFSPDGKLLASGGEDGTARLWDVEKKEQRRLLPAARERVTAVVFSADAETLMTGAVFESGSTYDGQRFPRYIPEPVRLWKVATGTEVRRLAQPGSSVATGAGGKSLTIVQMRTGTVGGSRDEGLYNLTAGIVSVIDATTEKPLLVVEGHGGAAALSPDGRLLATARGSDLHVGVKVRHRDPTPGAGDLRLWEMLTGQEVLRFAAGTPSVTPTVLAFAPDGRHLLFGTKAGAVYLVETAPPGVEESGRPQRQTLEGWWTDLGSTDAAIAYRAQVALGAARDDAPAFLAERMRGAPADDPGMVRLIADLEAERHVVRRAAFAELLRRGAEAEPALRAALKRAESRQVKQRLEELLGAPGVKVFPDPMRKLRVVQVLERIGTAEAKKVLADLPR
jgi:WD40 repeat protein